MALSARMLALIQKVEAANAAHFAALRGEGQEGEAVRGAEKIFARAAKAHFKKKTEG